MPALLKYLASLITLPIQWWIYLVVLLALTALAIGITKGVKKSNRETESKSAMVRPVESNLPTQVASAFLDVSLEITEKEIRKALTHSLSLFLMSDLCGLIENANQPGQFNVSQMFDLIREDYLADFLIPHAADTAVYEATDDGVALIANSNKNNQLFKEAFQTATGFNATGNLMIIPLSTEFQAPAILCLTPYTQREFLNHDVERLLPLKDKLIQVLSKASNLEERVTAAEALRLSLKQLTRNHSQIQEQLTRSQRILEQTNINFNNQKAETTEEVALWVERQQTLESDVNELTEKIAQSLAEVREAGQIRRQRDALEKALQENKRNLSELHATLANAQGVINRVIAAPESDNPVVVKPTTDLTYFTSSSDYLEHKTAQTLTARLNEIIQVTANEFVTRQIKLSATVEPIDSNFESQSLTVAQIVRLMQVNAYKASPNHAEVEICISMQQNENKQPALEMLITDQGGGLSAEEQSHFLRFARSSRHPAPAGIGDAQAIREAIALIDQTNGHLWIHSERDQLTTYRVLLPLSKQSIENSLLEK